MMVLAGRIQINKVSSARGIPPLLYPIRVRVWVEDAPGSNWQNPLYSISSSSVISFR